MSNQLCSDESRPTLNENRMSRLVDVWGPELTAAEFKLAARMYRSIEQSGGSDVRMTAREWAEAAGVSERFVETARKKLSAKGIIHLEINSTGSWCGFPRDAGAPENPTPETPADEAPAPSAAPDRDAATIAGFDIQARTTAAALNPEPLVPAAPGAPLPDLAADPAGGSGAGSCNRYARIRQSRRPAAAAGLHRMQVRQLEPNAPVRPRRFYLLQTMLPKSAQEFWLRRPPVPRLQNLTCSPN